MNAVNLETLRPVVYDIVAQIPAGRVLTYGRIAQLAGCPSHSRLVGRAMRTAPDGLLPCHRVVAAGGRLAPHYPGQRTLLEAEGVEFSPQGHVLLKRHLWQPDGL